MARQGAADLSNANWPCTDLKVDFGDIEPGKSATRRVYLGLGPYDREHWLGVVKRLEESKRLPASEDAGGPPAPPVLPVAPGKALLE